MRILLVEDDLPLAQALQQSLRHEGFVVDHVATGKDAITALAVNVHDMAILDLGLPDMDGLLVLKQLRAKKQATPVIILTARDTIEQRVQGLDFGDDSSFQFCRSTRQGGVEFRRRGPGPAECSLARHLWDRGPGPRWFRRDSQSARCPAQRWTRCVKPWCVRLSCRACRGRQRHPRRHPRRVL